MNKKGLGVTELVVLILVILFIIGLLLIFKESVFNLLK